MSLIEKLKSVRNNGSRRQAHIDLACECIKEVELLETQLKASHDEVSRLRKPICPQCETELEPCVQENYLYSESLDWFCECEVDDLSEIRSKLNQASETKGEG
jgi:hypothetical protein